MNPLVVLDLNGVLCNQNGKVNDGVDEFFAFLASKDYVAAVWTSKMEHNGRLILDKLAARLGRYPPLLFEWFRPHCTPGPIPDNPYATFKDLQNVWNNYPQYGPHNTVLVDDDEYKAGAWKQNLVLCVDNNLVRVSRELEESRTRLRNTYGTGTHSDC
jgi:hypothetical protein